MLLGRGRWLTLGREDVLKPEEARQLALRRLGEQAHGIDPIAEKRRGRTSTLDAFLGDQWKRANGITETATRVKQAFPEFLGKRLAEIDSFSVERWRLARHKAGVKAATTNRDLDALRAVLSRAVSWGVLREHPLKAVKRARLDVRGRVRYLTPDEDKRLREALAARVEQMRRGRESFNAWRRERGHPELPPHPRYADHLEPLVLLALNSGLRRGELFSLRWRHVDLGSRRLTVAGASAKTGVTRRVPLSDEAFDVLSTWRSQAGKDVDPMAYVFPSPQTGERLDNITTAWGALVQAAKLTDFTFHDLRHTFASRLVQAGVDLNVVRELLGHTSLVMTLRYAHLREQDTAAAVAKLIAG